VLDNAEEPVMQAPVEWALRAAVVAAPWVHPDRTHQYNTLLDAVVNADPEGLDLAPWIILEDGRMLNPQQIATLRKNIEAGSLSLPEGFLDF
jgi:hypothetical protein